MRKGATILSLSYFMFTVDATNLKSYLMSLRIRIKTIFHDVFLLLFSLADQKKEEGNQLYLAKNYREALQRYNEAISKFILNYL